MVVNVIILYHLTKEIMKIKLFKKSGLLAIILISSLQFGCQKSDNVTQPEVKLAASSTLGQYLVDKDGYALYYFSNDYNGRTSCFGGCATIWPYFYVANLTQDKLGSGLDIADFDTIVVNGVTQTRYKTWPLYYYAPLVNNQNVRESPGQTTGEGVGNIWYVGKPDYTIMISNAQLVGNDGKNYTNAYVEGTGKTNFFTNANGVSLYTFSKDSADINKFTKSDFSNNSVWPIYETSDIMVPSTLDKTLFGSITVFGKKQLTYKGWPLYYFGADNGIHGNTKGVSVPTPGVWPVAVKNVDLAPVKPN